MKINYFFLFCIEKDTYICIRNQNNLKQNIMASFTTLKKITNITNPNTKESVLISKVQKDGTKRTFFKIEKEGKLITRTMFVRLWEAEKVAKLYLNRNENN